MNLQKLKAKPRWLQAVIIVSVISLFTSCTNMVKEYTQLFGPAAPKERQLTSAELKQGNRISFINEVQPVLTNRCAVCHSCNDAPCQLNFTSMEGIDRGASIELVYNGARFSQQDPTRLGVDATTTAQWRSKGFFPVLNERRQEERINLHNSLLYQALVTKRNHPFPTEGRLPEEYNLGVELKEDESFVHTQVCPIVEEYAEFAEDNPQWGMPFAMPPITDEEFKKIETWLVQGAKVEPAKALSKVLKKQIKKWEDFFNAPSKKEQLVSRYIYEHLSLGHLYFSEVSDTDFFMMVRSRTPSGQPIDLISTVRPYNDPGVKKFYYRLQYYNRVIVDKTHLPYALNKKRMTRYNELFLEPAYTVDELPSYKAELAANPFETFKAIPSKNRYKFMLDEAQFFVGGFIKGAVCRGSIALSVIDDHFWLAFMDPDKSSLSQDSAFLEQVSSKLKMPNEQENSVSLLSVWSTYKDIAKDYFKAKADYINHHPERSKGLGIDKIWNGDKVNKNAALTIYRHYDSATVLKGFVGEVPKTGWVMDYPIFERVHYLLVAGFDIYGKAGHQLSTRLYMDFLRYESELQFLAFLPIKDRLKIHKHWYRDTDATEDLKKLLGEVNLNTHETLISYKTEDTKKEFFVNVSKHLQLVEFDQEDYLNRCIDFPVTCKASGWEERASVEAKALVELSAIKGLRTNIFPNVTFMRIIVDGTVENDQVFTIVRNKAYLNVQSLTASESTRVREEDSIDIIPGFVGAYPNLFLEIHSNELTRFVDEYKKINTYKEYDALVERYGVRRTNPNFWKSSDWFYKKHLYENKVYAGLFDLNRYKNR